jgi:hypothetical protein
MSCLVPYKRVSRVVQEGHGGSIARQQWQTPVWIHRRPRSMSSVEGGTSWLVPKPVLSCSNNLPIHCSFSDSVEDTGSLVLQGSKQMRCFYTGCPLTVPHHDLKLAAKHNPGYRPTEFGVSTLLASSCTAANSVTLGPRLLTA